MRKITAALLITGLVSAGFAAKEEKKENLFEKKLMQDIKVLNEKIENLYKLHVKECAPEYIAKAEAYLDAIDGMSYINPDTGQIERTEISPMDKIIFENKARKYLAIAKEKVYSDADGDGIPCYQEIEQGTNPFEAEKKVSRAETEMKEQKVSEKPEVKKVGYQPLKMHARIHFDFDKYNIKKDYLPYLNVITRYLKAHDNLKIKIVGYTDSIGSKEYNDRLARKRAEAIKKYLIDHGISPDRIEIIGKGKEDYLFDNNTPLNRFTNRRAEFFVMEPTESQ
ncbi:OmpA family protein [Persephonella sp.]|nr:OmpA family protein [Aquificota bacterium]